MESGPKSQQAMEKATMSPLENAPALENTTSDSVAAEGNVDTDTRDECRHQPTTETSAPGRKLLGEQQARTIKTIQAGCDIFTPAQVDKTPFTPKMVAAKRWHAEMAGADDASAAVSLRSDQIGKLVEALIPYWYPPDLKVPLTAYACKAEAELYEQSKSLKEYVQLIDAEIRIIQSNVVIDRRIELRRILDHRPRSQNGQPANDDKSAESAESGHWEKGTESAGSGRREKCTQTAKSEHREKGTASTESGHWEKDTTATVKEVTEALKCADADQQQQWMIRLLKENPAIVAKFMEWMDSREGPLVLGSERLLLAEEARQRSSKRPQSTAFVVCMFIVLIIACFSVFLRIFL